MVLTAIFVNCMSHGEAVQPRKPLSAFPLQISDFTGEKFLFDEKVYQILGVDDSFLCNYRAPDGRKIQLYIGYYQSQREGDIIHSPKNCMPGSGWNITRASFEELTIPNRQPGKIQVSKLILKKEAQQQVVLYWFQSRGRFIASEYMQKIYLVWDAIFKNRTDGSFIRLIAPVHENENETDTTDYVKTLAQDLIPILEQYLPSS